MRQNFLLLSTVLFVFSLFFRIPRESPNRQSRKQSVTLSLPKLECEKLAETASQLIDETVPSNICFETIVYTYTNKDFYRVSSFQWIFVIPSKTTGAQYTYEPTCLKPKAHSLNRRKGKQERP